MNRADQTIFAVACAAVLAGCAAAAPDFESGFGDSSRMLRAAQVVDAQAPGRHAGPGTTDGKAVAGALKTYAESYGYAVKESKQQPLSIVPTAGR